MTNISPLTYKLIKDFSRSDNEELPSNEDFLKWRKKHLLRKKVLENIIRKKYFLKKKIQKKVSSDLIEEIIAKSEHSQEKINSNDKKILQNALLKYRDIIRNLSKDNLLNKKTYNWLISLSSSELEEIIFPYRKNKSLVFYMTHSLGNMIKIEKDNETFLYIAVWKILFNLDNETIGYHIIRNKYPDWGNFKEEELKEVSKKIIEEKNKIDQYFKNYYLKKILYLSKRYKNHFLIIKNILSENIEKAKHVFQDPEKIEKEINKNYEKKISHLKKEKLNKISHYIITLFLVRIIFFLVIELPLISITGDKFSSFHIFITLLLPIILVLIFSLTISLPKEKNQKKFVLETMSIIYKKDFGDNYNFKKKNKSFTHILVGIIYTIFFVLFFGIIIISLNLIGFPFIFSLILFFFISLSSFLTIKMGRKIREVWIIEEKNKKFNTVIETLSLPLIYLEKYFTLLQEKHEKILKIENISFGKIIKKKREWRNYLKEKKENIYK